MYLLKHNNLTPEAKEQFNLHSTMYLLKLIAADLSKTELANLHSTMYLLKHVVLNDIILIS